MQECQQDGQNKTPFWKTRLCKFWKAGQCTRQDCGFAHTKTELRKSPNFAMTAICPTLLTNDTCKDPNCRYAHDIQELRKIPDSMKTKTCKFYAQDGNCYMGSRCRFVHRDERDMSENQTEATAPSPNSLQWDSSWLGTCIASNDSAHGVSEDVTLSFSKRHHRATHSLSNTIMSTDESQTKSTLDTMAPNAYTKGQELRYSGPLQSRKMNDQTEATASYSNSVQWDPSSSGKWNASYDSAPGVSEDVAPTFSKHRRRVKTSSALSNTVLSTNESQTKSTSDVTAPNAYTKGRELQCSSPLRRHKMNLKLANDQNLRPSPSFYHQITPSGNTWPLANLGGNGSGSSNANLCHLPSHQMLGREFDVKNTFIRIKDNAPLARRRSRSCEF